MRTVFKISALFLCLIILLSSCKAPDPTVVPSETAEASQTVEAVEKDPAAPYRWLSKPSIAGDILPIYSIMSNDICSFGLFLWQDGDTYKLIDSEGEFKSELNRDGYGYCYCDVCGGITDHMCILNPETYEPEEYMGGHDGPDNSPLIYDLETAEVYTAYIGGYELTGYIPDTAVVSLCKRMPLSEDKMTWSEVDYKYENTEGYGILVNGKLKSRGYEMYSRYSNGVVAMRIDGKWGYYDTEGNEILPCEYSPSTQQLYNSLYELEYVPYQATYGVIALCRNGKWGYADTAGRMITDFVFDEARPVYKNKGWVKTAEGWGIIELDYSCPAASDEFIAQAMAEKYAWNGQPVSIEQTGTVTLYETEFKKYLTDGEFTWYVTDDGHMISDPNS